MREDYSDSAFALWRGRLEPFRIQVLDGGVGAKLVESVRAAIRAIEASEVELLELLLVYLPVLESGLLRDARSTGAALRLLARLHARYADWGLALTAYNAGPGAVDAAIAQAGSRDFATVLAYFTPIWTPSSRGCSYPCSASES